MDAAEAREERLKAKAARDAAKVKYDAAPLTSAEHKELEKDLLRAEVSLAQANLEWVKAQVPRNEGDVADAKEALARADRELDKVTGAGSLHNSHDGSNPRCSRSALAQASLGRAR